MDTGVIELSFPDEGNVDAGIVAEYLMLFRAAYAAAASMSEEKALGGVDDAGSDTARRMLMDHLRCIGLGKVDSLFGQKSEAAGLRIVRVGHGSSLEVVLEGILFPGVTRPYRIMGLELIEKGDQNVSP